MRPLLSVDRCDPVSPPDILPVTPYPVPPAGALTCARAGLNPTAPIPCIIPLGGRRALPPATIRVGERVAMGGGPEGSKEASRSKEMSGGASSSLRPDSSHDSHPAGSASR
eukprot:462963-Rhodomonas_salina.1